MIRSIKNKNTTKKVNMKTVNSRGFAHFALLALAIVGVGVFGTYKMVANNIQSPYRQAASRIAQPKSTADCRTAVNSGPEYFYDGARCVTLANINCPAGTRKNTTPAPNQTYYCTGTPKKVATKAPTNTEECTKIVGQTYFYDGTRCVTLIKPTCMAGTGLVTAKNNANMDVYYCKAGVKTPKVKATYTLSYGARLAGDDSVGFASEFTARNNNQLEFAVVLNNTSSVAIENVRVNLNGFNTRRLAIEYFSSGYDGPDMRGSKPSTIQIGSLPANTIKRVTFLARVNDTVAVCNKKKINTRVTVTAKAVPALAKSTSIQVCP